MQKEKHIKTISLFCARAWSLCVANLHAQSEPFYKGKSIRIIVGLTPGGFYDRWARLLARYMPKYIPGNPEIIVQNMPGAGSMIAMNHIYNVAKPDGRTVGMPTNRDYLNQLSGPQHSQSDVQ